MAKVTRDNVDKFFDYGLDLDSKTLYLQSEVDSEMAMNAIKGLHILDRIKPDQPLVVHMENYGGEVYAGLAIYDYIINKVNSQVHIEIFGASMSMAVWILQAADRRVMSPSARIMVHQGSWQMDEDHPENIKKWIKQYEADERYLENILLNKIKIKKPKFTRQQLKDMLKFDTILNPRQAKDLGLIDEILGEE